MIHKKRIKIQRRASLKEKTAKEAWKNLRIGITNIWKARVRCESRRNLIFSSTFLINFFFYSSSPTWIISLLLQYFILLAGELD